MKQLEAVALLIEMSLPVGYRVREVEGRLYLFDPQGIPLHGPQDPSLIEAYAWRHAWRQIDRELHKELADLHAGVRPLHSLRRLRQYTRMLDAAARMPHAVAEPPVPRRMVAWGALAAAAAIAAVFWLTPLRTALVPEGTPRPGTSSQPAPARLARHPVPALSPERRASENGPVAPTARAEETSRGAVPATRAGARRQVLTASTVSFGQFVNRATANTMMHIIRSKGYIVYVARIGEEFWVVTRPYHTRAQAERLVNALQEIGLPAELPTASIFGGG